LKVVRKVVMVLSGIGILAIGWGLGG
jgi:hypothetical protein